MAGETRVALIALRAAPGAVTKAYHALIIGTDAADKWRFICYPYRQLLEMLQVAGNGQRLDPLEETTRRKYGGFWTDSAQAAGDPPNTLAAGRLSPDERSRIDANGDPFSGFPADAVRLPFREIVQVAFYRGNKSPFSQLHQPYARLDFVPGD